MEEKVEFATGKIHKLCVGSNLITYFVVGHTNEQTNSTVVEIVEDINFFIEYGLTKYLIISENNTTKERWLSASPINLPFLIYYSNPKGKPENIK